MDDVAKAKEAMDKIAKENPAWPFGVSFCYWGRVSKYTFQGHIKFLPCYPYVHIAGGITDEYEYLKRIFGAGGFMPYINFGIHFESKAEVEKFGANVRKSG